MKSIILTLGLAALAGTATAKQTCKAKAEAEAKANRVKGATKTDFCEGAGYDSSKVDTECGGANGKGTTCLATECCNGVVECDFTHWYMKTDPTSFEVTMEETEGAVKQSCMYYQECYESKNKTLSGCITKGNQVCERYSQLGKDGDVVAISGVDATYTQAGGGSCHPTSTCCGDKCCTDKQSCVALPGGDLGSKYDSFEYDFTTQSVRKIQQNKGKMANGEAPKNSPMMCVDQVFGPNKATKAVVTPLVAMLLLATVAIAGFRRSNTGLFDKIAPAVVFLTGFFLMLSEGSAFSLLTAVVASTTMACPDNKKGYLVIGQLFFLWLLMGGTQFFFGNDRNTLTNYFVKAQSTNMDQLGKDCSEYYANYFVYAGAGKAKAWSIAPSRIYSGLCSREFIGFQVFMAYINAFAVFAMVAHTTHVYLAPIAGVATNDQAKTETPVEMATVTNGV